MMLTVDQIKKMYAAIEQFPEAQYVVIEYKDNGSAIGPSEYAVFQDRGNFFRKIAPKTIGKIDITDTSLW